jgi:hypothetical protein
VTRELLLSTGLVLLLAACGGGSESHYTYGGSAACLRKLGKTQKMGNQQNAVRLTTDKTKAFDILFLPSGQQATNYTKQFRVPRGILHTKGNVIVYGHQTGTVGPEVTDDEMSAVEDCLA